MTTDRGPAIIPAKDVKIGDVLTADDSHTRLRAQAEYVVRAQTDYSGRQQLFVEGGKGYRFYLFSVDAGENYVGFWKKDKGAS